MNCDKYINLVPIEKVEFTGKLIHAVQNDNELFDAAMELIKRAEEKKMFESTTFVPHELRDQPIPDLVNTSKIFHFNNEQVLQHTGN